VRPFMTERALPDSRSRAACSTHSGFSRGRLSSAYKVGRAPRLVG
jgi:hypothetical protein